MAMGQGAPAAALATWFTQGLPTRLPGLRPEAAPDSASGGALRQVQEHTRTQARGPPLVSPASIRIATTSASPMSSAYHFVRPHDSLQLPVPGLVSGCILRTPPMAADCDQLWSVGTILKKPLYRPAPASSAVLGSSIAKGVAASRGCQFGRFGLSLNTLPANSAPATRFSNPRSGHLRSH